MNMAKARKAYVKSTKEKWEPLFRGLAANFRAGVVLLKSEEAIGAHSTKDNEEIIIVIAGRGKALFEGGSMAVREGDVIYVPPNTVHNLVADKNTKLRYVYVVTGNRNKSLGGSHAQK